MQKSLKKYFPVFVLPTLAAFAVSFVVPVVMKLLTLLDVVHHLY